MRCLSLSKTIDRLALGLVVLALLAAFVWLQLISNRAYRRGEVVGLIFNERNLTRETARTYTNEPFYRAFWTPSEKDIDLADAAWQLYFQEHRPDLDHQDLVRQYFGFNRSDQPYIAIIAFCPSDQIDWTQQLVRAHPRKGCFFEAHYDLEQEAILFLIEFPYGP